MATPLLGLALPVTGSLNNQWGDTVNNSITSLLDSAVAGTTTLSTDADVTLTTTQEASNQARSAVLLWTAAGTVTRIITAPAQSKAYVVINSSSTQSIKLVGVGPTTGVTIAAGEKCVAAWNGSDFVKVSGLTLTTTGTSGAATLVGNTLNIPQYAGGGGGGTVTSVSVASSNGFAGTVANATSTPAITVSTSITGVLKGNGTAISAATANTDYQSPITLTTTGTSGAASFNGTALNIPQYSSGGGSGTVTNVSGTAPISVSNGTTTPGITITQATTSISGYLSSTDWNTFNGKQGAISLTTNGTSGAATLVGTTLNIPQYSSGGGGGTVTNVSGTAPISVTNGTTTPAITIIQATASASGYLSSTDWSTFNGKGSGTVTSVGGTGSVNGITLTGTVTSTGNLTLGGSLSNVSLSTQVTGTLPIGNGGTSATTKATAFDALSPMSVAGDIIYGGASGTGTRLGVGSAGQVLTVVSGAPAWSALTLSSPSVTGNLTFSTSDAGVIFNKSGALVNSTLNDYEEGTWTPIFTRAGSAPTVSYAARQGRYTKIGRLVYISVIVSVISQSGGSGNYAIQGLPFPPASLESEAIGMAVSNSAGITLSGAYLTMTPIQSTFGIYFSQNYVNGTTSSYLSSGIASTMQINFSGTYSV
jgi:hypothetical protein